MAKIPPHIVDEIIQTARIEEVIGDFVSLKRAGSNLKGLSPFTDEKTPSFVVSPGKQIFKCFSTSKGGNVVSFLMEKEHFSYPEALRWLAERYGIQIPEDRPETPEEIAARSERESLHIINEFARDHFKDNLHNSNEGKKIGMSYFVERGFRPDIIDKFELGYCLNSGKGFSDAALAKGYKLEYMEKVGLTKTKDDRYFDFFRGRVIFPIHSVSGRVLGFGGRTLITDKKVAKYFNSPESIIYNKSEILYGLYHSKGDIIKYDQCYLCEGYTDVIAMYQAGIQNVVASSGTSLTKEQIRLVKRYTKNMTILYDGDAAGIKASFRGIDLILEEGMNVKVVLFPEGEDPDSYSKSVSTSELETYLKEHTQDFISFKADILTDEDDDDPIKRAEFIRDIIHSVSLIPDQITRNVYMQTIGQRFDMSEQVLASELAKLRKEKLDQDAKRSARAQQTPRPAPSSNQIHPDLPPEDWVPPEYRDEPTQETAKAKPSTPQIDHNEYDLMRILVQYGPLALTQKGLNDQGEEEEFETSIAELICHELDVDELTFEHPTYAKMHRIITDALSENTLLKSSYFKRMEDQDIVRFVSDIEMNEREVSHNWVAKYNIYTNTEKDKLQAAVMGSIYSFKHSKVEQRIRKIQERLADSSNLPDDEELMGLLAEQVALENVKRALAERLGRIVLR
ncbi:MAG: DNA primase [Flavobacteriales bacterium]|nr:DNA primase [Flavobacteriales bacterium]